MNQGYGKKGKANCGEDSTAMNPEYCAAAPRRGNSHRNWCRDQAMPCVTILTEVKPVFMGNLEENFCGTRWHQEDASSKLMSLVEEGDDNSSFSFCQLPVLFLQMEFSQM